MKTYTDEQIAKVREALEDGTRTIEIYHGEWRHMVVRGKEAIAILDQPQESEDAQDADSEVYLTEHGYACVRCGKPMSLNVPRLGPSGGFVHAATGKFGELHT